jgi:hypothetical protein
MVSGNGEPGNGCVMPTAENNKNVKNVKILDFIKLFLNVIFRN